MRFGAALVLCFGLVTAGCSSDREQQAATRSAPRLLTGIVFGSEGQLVRLEPNRLRLKARPRVALAGHTGPWALSPDRARLAIASRWAIRLIDLKRMRVIDDVHIGTESVEALAWPTPGRLLVAGLFWESTLRPMAELLAIDVAQRRIVARHHVPGFVADYARGRRDLQLLVAENERIGPARLVVIDADGKMRSLLLPRILSGTEVDTGQKDPTRSFYRTPGLATTGDGRTFVVAHDDLVAEIDLADLRASYHELQEKESLLGRALNWLEPTAHAKGPFNGSHRRALWLGGDRLAVFGCNDQAIRGAHGWFQRETPASLRLVDTRSWTVRTIDRDADLARRAGRFLLAYGTSYSTEEGRFRGDGVRVYTLSGDPVYRLFRHQPVWDVQVAGSRAYVSFEGGGLNATVDLAGGEVLARFEDGSLPTVLTGGRDRSPG